MYKLEGCTIDEYVIVEIIGDLEFGFGLVRDNQQYKISVLLFDHKNFEVRSIGNSETIEGAFDLFFGVVGELQAVR